MILNILLDSSRGPLLVATKRGQRLKVIVTLNCVTLEYIGQTIIWFLQNQVTLTFDLEMKVHISNVNPVDIEIAYSQGT